ncbi:phosphotransferase family protein [Natrinema caseinilyticum]|uniref:phosphotransferase family protein n=1 Tax=Natrinema caseinilyticum TaxID=2961570 RepID=UPI0020C32ABF|nr:phosphotransferase family protein [Natrinema caseinilyticum]
MADDVSVDAATLRSHLEEQLGEDRPIELAPIEAGRSNETVSVTWGDRKLILRKPPSGESSEDAHDVLREYRIMDALQKTAVPVPEMILVCDDHDVIGSDFYLMEYLDGHVVRGEEPDVFSASDSRRRFGEELVETLASIHTVDIEGVGLGDLGHPDGFTERQVERWGKQLEWALDRTERRDELSELEAVGDWLEENVPTATPQTLVHGDYKIDNVLFGPDPPPEIIGVLDWEMGTYGDPLTDLGWFLVHWHDGGDSDPVFPTVTPPFLDAEGYATRRELVERYERESGIELTDERFYRALAAYKEAAACEVFYARFLRGAENPFFEQMDEKVPEAAVRAKRIVDGEERL